MKPRLIVEQKITIFVNQYAVYEATPEGTKGKLLAFAQQKRVTFKEKITFYSDEQKTQIAFGLRAEKILDVHGKYLVEDAQDQPVGAFRKQFKQSLIRSSWNILDADDSPLVEVRENNLFLAIIRRFAGFIPYIGEIVELLVNFFRYHFAFTDLKTGLEVGRYQKTTLLRDHYLLSMTDEAYAAHDWRVLAAMAVGLDALQSR